MGIAVVVGVYVLQGFIGGALKDDVALGLLLILIILAPLQALDSLLIAMFATFGSARSIFFRRYVVGAPPPARRRRRAHRSRESGALTLAIGYVAASAIGIALYAVVLLSNCSRSQGLLENLREQRVRPPVRELFTFSAPLLASDIVFVLRSSVTIILLERPPVRRRGRRLSGRSCRWRSRCMFVATSFRFDLHAGGLTAVRPQRRHRPQRPVLADRDLDRPAHASRCSSSGWRWGNRWPSSSSANRTAGTGIILSTLVLGHYLSAAIGFNSLMLRVFGRVRFMMTVDLVTAVGCLVLTIVLIERLGALGAAIATSATLDRPERVVPVGAPDPVDGPVPSTDGSRARTSRSSSERWRCWRSPSPRVRRCSSASPGRPPSRSSCSSSIGRRCGSWRRTRSSLDCRSCAGCSRPADPVDPFTRPPIFASFAGLLRPVDPAVRWTVVEVGPGLVRCRRSGRRRGPRLGAHAGARPTDARDGHPGDPARGGPRETARATAGRPARRRSIACHRSVGPGGCARRSAGRR